MSAITPDGFSGALVAVESIDDARVLLHGPGGCRFRYMRLSQELYSRGDDGRSYDLPYFFDRPRVPCTYIDDNDYIGGGSGKVRDALQVVAGVDDSFIVVLNSPGMALIGDDVESVISDLGMEDRAMTISDNLVSLPLSTGFDRMMVAILRRIAPENPGTLEGTVNLLGLSTLCRDWKHGREELEHIISLMGLEVVSAPGAGGCMEDLRVSVRAEFNVCVVPEFCSAQSAFYESEYGIPACVSGSGAPIGFDAVRDWILSVADVTGRDPSRALDYVDGTRAEAKRIMMSDERRVNRIRTATFSIRGDCSVVRPLTMWLYGYLSMLPKAVYVEDSGSPEASRRFGEELESCNLGHVFGRDIEPADFIMGPGDLVRMYAIAGKCGDYLDLGFPPSRTFDFTYGSLFGARGAMYILDRILNE